MNRITYFFLRLPIAISLLGHGLVRMPKLKGFAEWMATSMEKSFLPGAFIKTFGFALPFFEALIGLWILLGFQTKYSLYAGLTLMSILILGSASVENWGAIQTQLVHAIYLFGLLWYSEIKTQKHE